MSKTEAVLKLAATVLFLRRKRTRSRPSHSAKSTGGGGVRGYMRTTDESTWGGGLKLLRDTFMTCTMRDSNCVFTDSRQ